MASDPLPRPLVQLLVDAARAKRPIGPALLARVERHLEACETAGDLARGSVPLTRLAQTLTEADRPEDAAGILELVHRHAERFTRLLSEDRDRQADAARAQRARYYALMGDHRGAAGLSSAPSIDARPVGTLRVKDMQPLPAIIR